MRVLTALSQETSSAACADVFSSFGWEVDSTTEPSMAESLLTFRPYDAVVTDLQFDNWLCRAGLDVVRAAKRNGRTPIVAVLSTVLSESVLCEARAAGADCVLLKPQSLHDIAARLSASAVQQATRPAMQADRE